MDQSNPNPTPTPSDTPSGDQSSGAPAMDGQQSAAQEQNTVNDQVNTAMGGGSDAPSGDAGAAPAGDSGAADTTGPAPMPSSEPPAAPATPPADTGTPPTDPTSNAL